VLVAEELQNLGFVRLHQHDLEIAARLFRQALPVFRAQGRQNSIAASLGAFAALAGESHDYERAAELYGAMEAVLDRVRATLDPDDQADLDRYQPGVRRALGDRAFDAARARGRALTTERAIVLALR
jgi:hypothetical protein